MPRMRQECCHPNEGTFAFAGLALAAAALPAALGFAGDFAVTPLLLGGVAAAAGAAGFEPPGLPKNDAMLRCLPLAPDIWADLAGAGLLRRVVQAASNGRCTQTAVLGRKKPEWHNVMRAPGSLSRAA